MIPPSKQITDHVTDVVAAHAERAVKQVLLEKMQREIGVTKRPNTLETGNNDIRLVEYTNLRQEVGKILAQGKKERWGAKMYQLAIAGLKQRVQNAKRQQQQTQQPQKFELNDNDLKRFNELLAKFVRQG